MMRVEQPSPMAVSHRAADVPPAVLARTKLLLLDTIACAIAVRDA